MGWERGFLCQLVFLILIKKYIYMQLHKNESKDIPLSSIKTMLLLSNFGIKGFCFCFTPTITAFFFCPLMATKTLSPEINSNLVLRKSKFYLVIHHLPIVPTIVLL